MASVTLAAKHGFKISNPELREAIDRERLRVIQETQIGLSNGQPVAR